MSSSFCSWHSATEYIIKKKILITVLPVYLVEGMILWNREQIQPQNKIKQLFLLIL